MDANVTKENGSTKGSGPPGTGYASLLVFGPFRLDPAHSKLWRDQQRVPLRPKALAVLSYLANNPGQVVSRNELLQQVWRNRYVTVGSLRACVYDIRQALHDDPASPRYIETVGRKGYRFLNGATHRSQDVLPEVAAHSRTQLNLVVGRQAELAQLHKWFGNAAEGSPQLAFVSGDAGSGKTTLVECFVEQVCNSQAVIVGRGHCLMQLGQTESYGPLLEALYDIERSTSTTGQLELAKVAKEVAPAWLALLPDLVDDCDMQWPREQLRLMTATRMQQLFVRLIGALSADLPLILVLEDLHWSDVSMLQMLSYLARNVASPMRLLVLCTFRSNEPVASVKLMARLQDDLIVHRLCNTLELAPLKIAEVAAYAGMRLDGVVDDGLTDAIFKRTDGNALFAVALVEQLLSDNLIEHTDGRWRLSARTYTDHTVDLPKEVGLLVRSQYFALDKNDQEILAAASVAGRKFIPALFAGSISLGEDALESRCEVMTRNYRLIDELSPQQLPDGTIHGCYQFRHELYQQAIYAELSRLKRSQLHLRTGERLAEVFQDSIDEVAGELAHHFKKAGQTARAARLHRQAATRSMSRHALDDAIAHCRAGLDAVLDDDRDAEPIRLHLLFTLISAIIAKSGWTDGHLESIYAQARELCQRCGDNEREFELLNYQRVYYFLRGDLEKATKKLQAMKDVNRRSPTDEQSAEFFRSSYQLAYVSGDGHNSPAITDREGLVGKAYERFSGADYQALAASIAGQNTRARVLWHRGYPDQAFALCKRSAEIAEVNGTPWEMITTLQGLAAVCQLRGDVDECAAAVSKLSGLTANYGMPPYQALQHINESWLAACRGSYDEALSFLTRAERIFLRIDMEYGKDYVHVVRAEVAFRRGAIDDGLAAIDAGIAYSERTGLCLLLPELHRLRGALLCEFCGPGAPAEASFQTARKLAQDMTSKSLELRAAVSLARMWRLNGKVLEATMLLEPLYDGFKEGHETVDLRGAANVLDELAAQS